MNKKNPIQNIVKYISKNNILSFHIIITLLLIINLTISFVVLSNKNGNTQNAQSAIRLEQLKAGGEENFELVKELYTHDSYKNQQKQAIISALNSIKGQNNNIQQPTKQETANKINTGTPDNNLKEKFKEIVKDSPIVGKKNTKLTILEYSELVCPFCKRQHDQNVLGKILEKYPNDVNKSFRHFMVHPPLATKLAEGAECVREQKGDDGFYEYIKDAFSKNGLTEEYLTTVASTLNIDSTKFDLCISEGRYTDRVNEQTNEGRSIFGVNGTPGNVIIDNDTGRFVLISGAYPFETFDETIKEMLK